MGKIKDKKALQEAKADKKSVLGVKRQQLKRRKKSGGPDGAVHSEDVAQHGVLEDKEVAQSKKNALAKLKKKMKQLKAGTSYSKPDDLVEFLSENKNEITPKMKKKKKKLKEGASSVEANDVEESPFDNKDEGMPKLKKKKNKKLNDGKSSADANDVQESLFDNNDAGMPKLKKSKKNKKLKKGKISVEPNDAEDILLGNQDEEILSADVSQLEAQSEDVDIGEPEEVKRGKKRKTRRVKKSGGSDKKDMHPSSKEEKLVSLVEVDPANVDEIPSVDEDCSRGMKKWILEYKQKRPGLKVLQQRIDEFIIAHEEQQEQERKEREACAAEEGWTVVVHQKGRKKTTDAETGTTVGSVSLAALQEKTIKKKPKEVDLNFYRFQKREAQRNEILMLQSKFEQDKKRIQQLRAQRKFKPY